MPAGSDPAPSPGPAAHLAAARSSRRRHRGDRRAGRGGRRSGWFSFDDETRARFTWFQRGTLVFFGLIYLALMLALIRSRAVAYADRLVVVNGYRRHEYEWPQIVAARLPPGAPWVTLDLADGETASVLGDPGLRRPSAPASPSASSGPSSPPPRPPPVDT